MVSFSHLFGKKNPLDTMGIEELRLLEIRLTSKIETVQDEVRHLEQNINFHFNEAKVVQSKSQELSIARRIDTISKKREMKLSAQTQLEKELRAISNLLILKEHEADLQSAGVWENIAALEPDRVEEWLIKKNLAGEDRDALVTEITQMTGEAMTVGTEESDDLREILDAIHAVKEGNLEPEDAELRVTERRMETD